ncbi:hypothetical protein DITRI_Ditri07aG0074700 [Diplodiscus trichospermus]
MMSNLYDKVAFVACEGWSWGCSGLAAQTIFRTAATLMTAMLAVVCCAWLAKKLARSKLPPLPPGPPGAPILGNLPFIQPDLHQYFAKLSQIYGPIIKLQMGRKVWIIISSPSLAKEVLRDHDAIFANHDPPAGTVVGMYAGNDILFTANGPEFRKRRKLVVHDVMSNRSLDNYYEIRRREIRKLVKDIYGKVGSSIHVGEEIFQTNLSVMISTLWGGSLDGEEGSRLRIECRKRVQEFLELVGAPNISDLFPVLAPFDLQGIESKTKKHVAWFYDVFQSVIIQRTKSGELGKKSHDFLQQMLELQQQGDDHKNSLSMNEVKALLLDLLIGGTDTISTTTEWAMTELMRHPDKMTRVVEELDKVVGNQKIVEESHLPRLQYLQAVIKETLRIHPPAPLLIPHGPSKTCIVAGYTIPKHSSVFINAWAIQRDPEFWENPFQFEPERFLNESDQKVNYLGNSFQFLPFGSGRRICPGLLMAEKTVSYFLAILVHSFEWKLPDGEMLDIKDKLRLVLSKLEPLTAIAVPRLSTPLQYQ